MSRMILQFLTSLLVFSSLAHAQVLFSEDFQDGNADGWIAQGEGNINVTVYAGNYSLQLTNSAAAIIGLQIQGPPTVSISASFAADGLERKDACLLEASTDRGSNWQELYRIADGQDDSVTLYTGGDEITSPPEGIPLFVRLRIDGNANNDICWADNIRVVATPVVSKLDTDAPRDVLTADFLQGQERFTSPVNMQAFAALGENSPASLDAPFRLQFSINERDAGFSTYRDRFNFAANPLPRLGVLPDLDMVFIPSGNRVVPIERGLMRTDHLAWDWLVEPGFVWQELSDDGLYRVAIPFALQERNANCTHNGILTFLTDGQGSASRLVYQVASETCSYFQYDMWGTAQAELSIANDAQADSLAEAYQDELSARMPTKPMSTIEIDYPGLDLSAFANPTDVSPEHMTTYGVIYNGVHYRGDCNTRHGPYPYCEDMLLPSYSTAKSVFAGLAPMRLEKLFSGAMEEKIADHVPACAAAGWDGITFDHALDMATGRYNSTEPDIDESAAVQDGFFLVDAHKDKIDRACTIYPKRDVPGKTFVYHTIAHYILGTAMQAYLRNINGAEADIYEDLLVEPLFKPLGMSPVSWKTRRSRDEVNQPYMGWGLTFLADDVAKFSAFLSEAAQNNGEQDYLDRNQLAAALQMNTSDPGLPAPSHPLRYNNGFWAYDATSLAQCDAPLWVPFMSGFGGISVVLMPNGLTYYYFSDNGQFAWARAVTASANFKDMCGNE